MIKKIYQTILLIVLVAGILMVAILLGGRNIDSIANVIKEIDFKILLLASVIVSSILVLIINRLLKYMGEVRYLHSPLSRIDKMTGEEFEYYLKLRLERLGFKVEMTPASNDYGADLFCFDNNGTIVVQVKRYEGNVGTAAVQEIVAAREYYNADGCVVITNSFFTINALNLAEANEVALIDRDDLLSFRREKLYFSES